MLTLQGRPGRPAATMTVLLLPFIMGKWQTNWHKWPCFTSARCLRTFCGANMAANNKTRWHCPVFMLEASQWGVLLSTSSVWHGHGPAATSGAELSCRAALKPCWDLPDPQLSLPGASAAVSVNYNPCSWHTHANRDTHIQIALNVYSM